MTDLIPDVEHLDTEEIPEHPVLHNDGVQDDEVPQ